jgi:hypothetical protein
MQRFFFDVHDDEESVVDREGQVCSDIEVARKEAQRIITDVARLDIPNNGDKRHLTVLVRDEASQPLYAATLLYAGFRLLPGNKEEQS